MSERIRVLCVDDEIYILNVVKRQLINEPVEVYCVQTAADGLLLIRNLGSVQVVISDYRMPGMDGMEFLRQAAILSPGAQCILLSGFADMGALDQFQAEERLYGVLHKPWLADELRRLIGAAAAVTQRQSEISPEVRP